MPKLTPHQNRIMQMEPIYKAQTTMLQWLRRQGHAVEFGHDPVAVETMQEMPPRPLGKVAMRYVGRPCPYCGVEDALAGDRNAPCRSCALPRYSGRLRRAASSPAPIGSTRA